MNSWEMYRFGDICEHSAFGPRFSGELYSPKGNIATLRTTDISEDGFINYLTMPLAQVDVSKFQRHFLQKDDLVITRSGRVGTTAVFTSFRLPVLPGAFLLRFRLNRDIAEPAFYRYFFNSPIGQHLLLSTATGSAQQNLNITALHELVIPVPPLNEQREIAHTLGTLDDKIELNRRMNATLEATARAIFESWFVDFDPVRAKAEGRQPEGMDAETAALFPDSFEESELGPIPRGWRVGRLSETIQIISGGTPKTSVPEYWDGDIFWFSVKDVPADSDVFVVETEKRITQAGVNNSAAKVLPALTTIISARGTVGKLALTGVEMAMNQSCYAVRGGGGYPNFFTYFQLKAQVSNLQQQTHGTVFDTITTSTFDNLFAVLPELQIVRLYDATVEAMLERIRKNVFESRTLAKTRDALLPILMAGKRL